MTYSIVYRAVETQQEFGADPAAGLIVFYKEDLRLPSPAGIVLLTLLSVGLRSCARSFRRFGRHCIRDILRVFGIGWIDPVALANGIHHVVKVAHAHRAKRPDREGLLRRDRPP